MTFTPFEAHSLANALVSWGEAEDFAGAVVYLSSAAANYVHGTIITVDGGWMGR